MVLVYSADVALCLQETHILPPDHLDQVHHLLAKIEDGIVPHQAAQA